MAKTSEISDLEKTNSPLLQERHVHTTKHTGNARIEFLTVTRALVLRVCRINFSIVQRQYALFIEHRNIHLLPGAAIPKLL